MFPIGADGAKGHLWGWSLSLSLLKSPPSLQVCHRGFLKPQTLSVLSPLLSPSLRSGPCPLSPKSGRGHLFPYSPEVRLSSACSLEGGVYPPTACGWDPSLGPFPSATGLPTVTIPSVSTRWQASPGPAGLGLDFPVLLDPPFPD